MPLLASGFVMPEQTYINALLQSTGIMPHDDEFMTNFYSTIYREETAYCGCVGCWVNNVCVECLNERTCNRINGHYCE